MFSGPAMVLDVIAVIEEEEIVKPAIVAGCSARVFVMALQVTQSQPEQLTRKIRSEKESRHGDEQPAP